MKLRRIAFLFCCMLFFNYSFSQIPIVQEFKLTDSEPYKKVRGEMINNQYFYHKGKAIGIKFAGDNINYHMYDIDNLSSGKTITMLKGGDKPSKDYFPEGAIQKEDIVFQFFSFRDLRKGSRDGYKIFFQKIRISTGEVSGLKLLLTDDYILRIAGRRIKITPFGKDRFLINYKLINILERYPGKPLAPIRDGDERELLGFVVCDTEMNVLWKKKLVMPHRIKDVKVIDLLYDEPSEKLVMLVNRPNEEKYLEIWKFDKSGDDREIIKFSCDNTVNFIHSIRLKQLDNGNFFLAGFIGDRSFTNGFYVGEFDSNGATVKEFINEIPMKIINEYNKEKVQKKNLKKREHGELVGIQGLSLTNFTINTDGTIMLHGEVYNRNGSVNYGSIAMGGIPMASSEHFYRSMFAAKIDVSGKVIWMNKMPKNQLRDSGGPGAFYVLSAAPRFMDLSYNYIHNENYHYFVFMDHEENLNLPINEFPVEHAAGNRGVLIAYRINDETGELNKLHLFNSRGTRGMMLTGYFTKNLTRINDNGFFIEMHKKQREDVLLKVEFKD